METEKSKFLFGQRRNEKWSLQLAELSRERDNLQRQIVALPARISELERTLSQTREASVRLQCECNNKDGHIAKLDQLINSTRDEDAKIQTANVRVEKNNTILQDSVRELRDDLAEARTQNDALRSERDELASHVKQLHLLMSKLKSTPTGDKLSDTLGMPRKSSERVVNVSPSIATAVANSKPASVATPEQADDDTGSNFSI